MNKRKIIVMLCLTPLVVFMILNVVWFTYVYTEYHKYETAVGYDKDRQKYFYRDEDDFVYSVSRPYYLHYTGNLSISQVIHVDENGNVLNESVVGLIIWPDIQGNCEYGVTIEIPEKNNKDSGNAYVSYEFLLDDEQQSVEQLNDHDESILTSHRDDIDVLYEKSRKMWGIPSSEQEE